MKIYGLEFTSDTIRRISQTLDEAPSTSGRSLARMVCGWRGWIAPSGRPKEAVCRKALKILDGKGLIALSHTTIHSRFKNGLKTDTISFPPSDEITCSLSDLAITIEMVGSRYSRSFRIWKEMLDRHHYLGSGPLCGAQIRYLVRSTAGYLGALSFSSAAFALKDRDRFIGWTEGARRYNLPRVICNSRFLIVPTVRVKNLASHILGRSAARISEDWKARYGVMPVMMETFVDPTFLGTSYRAANWIRIGHTSGRRGTDAKDIFLYPLCTKWQRILNEEPFTGLCQTPRADNPVDWVEEEFGTVGFYDPRLKRRLFNMVRDFYGQPRAPIPQACGSHSAAKAAYRFFDNERVTMDTMLRAHKESTVERIQAHQIVLAVQDTTSLNYTAHQATEGAGPINTTQDGLVGFLLHDTMAFTTEGTPLGLIDVQCWARDPQEKGKRDRRRELPIEQKESIKWLKSYRATDEVQKLCPKTMLVSVGDRESDMYELFLEAAQNPCGPEILVRCERSRNRKTGEDFLWDVMAERPIAGHQVVRIPARKGQSAREAHLEVRLACLTLKPPKGKQYPPVTVWMVYARENAGASPLEWMLLTTVATRSLDEGCERLNWYAKRWGIEVYHRTLKSGCKIEDRRLGTAESLEACLAVDMVVAWRIHHLTKLGRKVPNSPCTLFFEEAEWKALHIFVTKTPVLPDREPTLRDAIRMTASLEAFSDVRATKNPGLPLCGEVCKGYTISLPHIASWFLI
jgi:hypothetical protein